MSAVTPARVRVYLDQNVHSHIARGGSEWRKTEYAALLLGKLAGVAEVWISPTHGVETLLCPEHALRRVLAESMLALADGRRMLPDYSTLLVNGFLEFVERTCAEGILGREYPEYYDLTLRQQFLGATAMMALGYPPNPDVMSDIVRLKLEGRWLRAEAGCDPHKWVTQVKDAARNLRLTPNEPRPELTKKTNDEIVADISTFEANASRIEQKDRDAVNGEKGLFARAYGLSDVLQSLDTTFNQLPGDLLFTFNFAKLRSSWPSIVTKLKCLPLPTEPAPDAHVFWMLVELGRSLWREENGGMPAAEIAQEVVLVDYLKRLNERVSEREKRQKQEGGKLPTDSLTFDADHAASALTQAHVFVTRDEILHTSTTSLAAKWEKRMHWKCEIAFTPEQMEEKVLVAAERLKKSA